MKFLLNVQRKVDYDQARELTFGDNASLKDKLAIAILNPEDFKALNLTNNSRVKLISQFGQVVVAAKEEKDTPKGMIIMPVSIWANRITGIEEDYMVYKNIEILVEPSSDPILTFEELIKDISRKEG